MLQVVCPADALVEQQRPAGRRTVIIFGIIIEDANGVHRRTPKNLHGGLPRSINDMEHQL